MEKKVRISVRLSTNNFEFIDKLAQSWFNGNKSKTIDRLLYILRGKENIQ